MTETPADAARRWRKSTFSAANGHSAEIGCRDGHIEIRNSRFPDDGFLAFTRAEWDAFVLGVKAGEFDSGVLPGEP